MWEYCCPYRSHLRWTVLIALLQRVSAASVTVHGEQIAAIGRGMLALVAVERGDTAREAERMADRLRRFRLFADAEGRIPGEVHRWSLRRRGCRPLIRQDAGPAELDLRR